MSEGKGRYFYKDLKGTTKVQYMLHMASQKLLLDTDSIKYITADIVHSIYSK